jgi:hypothetical protein
MTGSTPIWVPLAVAVIGLTATMIGTIAGVLITQRRSDRREQLTWEREREREREVWVREDAARTFDLRRDAYVAFYEAVDRALGAVVAQYRDLAARRVERGGGELSADLFVAVFQSMEKVSIYGSKSVTIVARDMYETVSIFGNVLSKGKANVPKDIDEFQRGLRERIDNLLDVMRINLGIPAD